jgi:MoxR-like ATPase
MNEMNSEVFDPLKYAPNHSATFEQHPDLNYAKTTLTILQEIRSELQKLVIGQSVAVDQVVACLIAGGHILLEGKPGLGKTYMVNALAKMFGGRFARVQFTPDLMPADVTGFTLFDMKSQTFTIRNGPVFTNLLLADEINRAPAKTQAALLEVMQEHQVTIDGECLKLSPPFMTLATQNPIEQEGTYPLPEAQLDRFLMKVIMDYPNHQKEVDIVNMVTQGRKVDTHVICDPETILAIQDEVRKVRAVPEVVDYAVNLTRATRNAQGIRLGAGTRGAISLVSVAKAYAVMGGRDYIVPDDVKYSAIPVLRHRIQLAPELAISGQSADDTLRILIAAVDAPRQ